MNGTEPRVGTLGRLAGAAYRRRGLVVVVWVLAVVAIGVFLSGVRDLVASFSRKTA